MRYLRELRRTLVRTGAALAFTGWAGLTLAGCGGSGSTGPSGSGSLTVTITAPSGVTPSVTVRTPTPIVTLSNGAALAGPFGLAFDPGPPNVPVNIVPH